MSRLRRYWGVGSRIWRVWVDRVWPILVETILLVGLAMLILLALFGGLVVAALTLWWLLATP